jgi:MFS family permease
VVLAAAVLLTIVLVPRHVAKAPGPAWQGTLPPGLVPLVAARFLFLLATYGVGRFLVLLVAERLGIAPERAADDAGWLLALFTLTTALAAIAFGWLADERSRRRLMTVGSVVAAAGIVTLVPETGLEGLIIGGLLMSVATAAFVSANWAAMTALVPGPQAGRLMGIANLGTALAAAAAGLFGPIIEGIGFAPALLLAAAASAAAIVPLTGWSEPATRPAEGIA